MANNYPADHGGQQSYGAEHVAQIAAMYNQYLDSMEESLLQAIRDMYSYTGPANITTTRVMLIHTVVKTVRQKLILEVGRQEMDPKFRLVYALVAVALGCASCILLMYVLLGDMPWLIFILCVLMSIIPSYPRIN